MSPGIPVVVSKGDSPRLSEILSLFNDSLSRTFSLPYYYEVTHLTYDDPTPVVSPLSKQTKQITL